MAYFKDAVCDLVGERSRSRSGLRRRRRPERPSHNQTDGGGHQDARRVRGFFILILNWEQGTLFVKFFAIESEFGDSFGYLNLYHRQEWGKTWKTFQSQR